jgi:hypothetical protein
MRYSLPVLFFICLLSVNHYYLQGCSDAGFYIAGSIYLPESD